MSRSDVDVEAELVMRFSLVQGDWRLGMVFGERTFRWLFSIALIAPALLFNSSLRLMADEDSQEDLQVVPVASGVYAQLGVHEMMSVTNLGSIGNSGFIVGAESVAVIDPGGSPEAGSRLKQAIEKVTDLPVEYLVLTHFHPDHVAGAVAFLDTPHVLAHENYARAMAQRAQFYLDRFSELLPGTVTQVFRLPTQTVPAGETINIDLGDRMLSIEAYPLAHTDNDVTVHDLQTNTLWASDLVFAQRTPSLDGSLGGWLDVMSMLEKRSYSLIVPGHGLPASWSVLAPPQSRYLQVLRDDVREFIAKSTSLSKVLEQHEKQSDGNAQWQLYEAQHGTNLAKTYSELEWE